MLRRSLIGILPVLVMPTVFWQSRANTSGAQQVLNAYQSRLSNVIVQNVNGVVSSLLSDDVEGSRHQRFIMRMAGGHTLLVVHNIDLAPRINGLRVGDRVTVKGEYERNERSDLISIAFLRLLAAFEVEGVPMSVLVEKTKKRSILSLKS